MCGLSWPQADGTAHRVSFHGAAPSAETKSWARLLHSWEDVHSEKLKKAPEKTRDPAPSTIWGNKSLKGPEREALFSGFAPEEALPGPPVNTPMRPQDRETPSTTAFLRVGKLRTTKADALDTKGVNTGHNPGLSHPQGTKRKSNITTEACLASCVGRSPPILLILHRLLTIILIWTDFPQLF